MVSAALVSAAVAAGIAPVVDAFLSIWLLRMAWFFILIADLFEIAWPFTLKRTAPLSRCAPLLIAILFAIPVNFLLAEAVKRLPAATVYATFVGVGTAGTAVVGMAVFREGTNIGRLLSLAVIVAGVVGLRFFSGAAE